MLHAQDSDQLSKSPANKNQVALDFVNRSQMLNSQSSTFPSPGFASKEPTKLSSKMFNSPEPDSTLLSQQKRASSIIFCNYTLLERARLYRRLPKLVEQTLAKFTGSVKEEELELAKQSFKQISPISCNFSKREVDFEANSLPSSQNHLNSPQYLDQSKY